MCEDLENLRNKMRVAIARDAKEVLTQTPGVPQKGMQGMGAAIRTGEARMGRAHREIPTGIPTILAKILEMSLRLLGLLTYQILPVISTSWIL
jgi:hypothetical protein